MSGGTAGSARGAAIDWATPDPGGLTPTDVATELVGAASQTLDTLDVKAGAYSRPPKPRSTQLPTCSESIFAPEPPKPEKVKQRSAGTGAHAHQRPRPIREKQSDRGRETARPAAEGDISETYGIDINASLEDQERQLRKSRIEAGGRASPPPAETAGRREGAPQSQPERRDNQRLRERFKTAARTVILPTSPPAPPKKARRRSGGGGRRPLITRALADDYVKLCQNPLQNLERWINEDKKTPRAGHPARARPTQTDRAQNGPHQQPLMADAHGLRRQPLQKMRGGLDTHVALRRSDHRLLARSRASPGRYGELRSLRSERGQQGLTSARPPFRAAAGLLTTRTSRRQGRGAANDQTRLAFATAKRRVTGRPSKPFRVAAGRFTSRAPPPSFGRACPHQRRGAQGA